MMKDRLPRKRPTKCINYHPEEIEIQQCGRASILISSSIILVNICMLLQMIMLTRA